MTDNNKIITTLNSITPDYEFIPDLNDVIVIDTSENRIGINTITPDVEIHVSGGTIKTENLTVLGDISVNYITSDLVPKHDLSYSLGSDTHNWKDIYVGPGTIYMNNTPIIHMGESIHNGLVDNYCLKIDNSGRPLDISGVNHVNIDGDISINGDLYIGGSLYVAGDISFVGILNVLDDTIFNQNVRINDSLTVLGDVTFTNSKLVVHNDASFNKNVDISGILNITELTNADGTETTSTKMYTTVEGNSQGVMTTRFIIDPAGDNIATNGEVVIMGNLDIKGTTVYFNSTEVDISDNIIRLNANHGSVTDGGIAVTNSSSVDKLFSYNNTGDYWSTNNTNIDLGPTTGVVSAGFMNIDNISIDGNAISRIGVGDLAVNSGTGQLQITSGMDINITSAQETTIQAGTGNVVIENLTFKNNTISTTGSTDLNISSGGGNIFTQNSNLDLGTGKLTVNSVEYAHVPTGVIMLWYGNSTNVPTGWVICDGTNGTPNLSGRFVVCSGDNTETDYIEDSSGGNDSYTLSIADLPSHNHDASSHSTDVQHNHTAYCGFTDPIHNHGATSQNTDVLHNHVASSQNTDVQHNHGATSQNTDIPHSHEASNSGFTDVSHHHTGTTDSTTDTHTHPDTIVSSAELSHTHTIQVTPNDHTHTANPSGTDADHQHVISESQAPHSHGLEFEFPYSTDEGGTGTVSLMTDDQDMGNLQITQLGGGFTGGVQTANATHTHTTETVGPTHSFYGQTEHLHTINQDTHGHNTTVEPHTTQHAHTLSLAPGGNPHNHTMTIEQANINHAHELLIESTSILHNHVIQTQQTSIDHNHVIQTQQTSIDHNHVIQTQQANINHNHLVQTCQASISHNHIIETAETGGGLPVDNRPKWYSLWYIMKV
jgi:hypothetical protein